MRRNLVLLAACQALLLTSVVTLVSTSALVGSHLATRPALSTLPLAVFNIGVMAVAVPASMLMERIGRRWGFVCGASAGVVGAAVAALGVTRGDFALFCGGMLVLGAFMAFGGYYRFAAAEVAPPEYRSKAIAYVTGGGVAAAFAGTWLPVLTQNVRGLPEFSASYMVVGIAAAFSVALALFLDVPAPTEADTGDSGRSLSVIARQPGYIVAVVAAALGYFVMGLIMNATPLAMKAYAFTFGTIAFVIQWHVLAMFAPSFVTGSVISRLGLRRVLAVGAALMAACVVINLLGTAETHFWFALVALGLGWNLLFIGGTTLLTGAYRSEERSKSQGLNDFIVYTAITAAALGAGAIHSTWGWRGINLSTVPAIAAIAAALMWLAATGREGGRPAGADASDR